MSINAGDRSGVGRETAVGSGSRAGEVFRLGALTGLFLLVFSVGVVQEAASAAKGAFDPQKHFTITKIEPDAEKQEVRLHFSHKLPLELLQAALRLLPRVKVDWEQSRLESAGILILKGEFRPGAGHFVTLRDGTAFQGRTYFPTLTTFVMPDRAPLVEFVGPQRVIERDSRQLLHVRVTNVESLQLEMVQVPGLLLPQALAAEKRGAPIKQMAAELGRLAAELQKVLSGKKAYAPFLAPVLEEHQLFPAGGEKNRVLAVSLPLTFRQHPKTGALELIRVRDQREGSRAATDPRLFCLTDIGLTYKISGNGLLVWATSLKDGTPLAGVEILAFTRNLEAFPLGQTDRNGLLLLTSREVEGISLKQEGKFHPVKKPLNLRDLTLLAAGKADDLSYVEVKPLGDLQPEEVWFTADPKEERNLKGVVFTERGVYRPGEKVYFKGTVREYRDGAILPPQNRTCIFTVVNPRGEQVLLKEETLSDFGTAAGVVETQSHWPVGIYTVNMSFGPEPQPVRKSQARRARPWEEEGPEETEGEGEPKGPRPEASTTFQLQEFRPPRHFTDIAFERFTREDKGVISREGPAEFVRIVISGAYYAGGPVKHGQVRWRIHQAPTSYQVTGLEEFTFGYPALEKELLIESGQAILDERGKTAVEFPLDRHLLSGRQGLSVTATVVDFDGRAATAGKNFQVDPEYRVGIRRLPEKLEPGAEYELKLVVVDREGKKLSQGALRAEVLERTFSYVAKRNEKGELYWDDEPLWRRVSASELQLKEGLAGFRFTCGMGGDYLLAFTYTDAKGRSFASAARVKTAWDYVPEEKRERAQHRLTLWSDRPAYRPGESAEIQINPKESVATYLVTVERDGILHSQVVPGGQGPKTVKLPIQREYSPNVYVSVVGLKPRGDFPVRPGRYDLEAPGFVWGTLNLAVLKEVEGLILKINPDKGDWRARPGEKVTVDLVVSTPKGQGLETEVALAAVDEAVLALTAFKTPSLEPLSRFDVPLSVFLGELRKYLVHQTPFYPTKVEPLTGGGGLSAELVSKLRRRFEPVAYFNPAVRTDPQGRARVSFTLPDNITSYRVYAVALDRTSRYGSSERQLTVAKEFYLEPGLPGFFTRGDKFSFLVTAQNHTPEQGEVKFGVTAEGGLSLKAETTRGQIRPQDSLALKVSGKATTAGPANMHLTGEFQGRKDEVEQAVRINSGHVQATQILFGTLKGEGVVKLSLPNYLARLEAATLATEAQAVLTISGSPFLRFSQPIHYLMEYPYGCAEQISSGILGLAAVRRLIREKLVRGIDPEKVEKFLAVGIGRLLNLQTEDGGFAYWPGQRYSHPWATLYALAALGVAHAQDLPVPEGATKKPYRQLHNKILFGKTTPWEMAFGAYALALNGFLSPNVLDKAWRHYPGLPEEGKLLLILAAAHSRLKPPEALRPLLRAILEGKEKDKVPGEVVEDDFAARYRGQAWALLAAATLMPADPLTSRAALALLGGLGPQGYWTSTSDTGWALLALGTYYRGAAFAAEGGSITVSQEGCPDRELSWAPQGSAGLTLDFPALLKKPEIRLKGDRDRTWLYQVTLRYPRLEVSEKGAERGFRLSKTVKNTDGSDTIRVGDLVKVTLQVEVQGLSRRYLALEDPLPAGLQALNTALKTEEPQPEEGQSPQDYLTEDGVLRFYPNHFEIREDRVLAFRDLVYPGTFRYEYFARAVCEGEFIMPPSQVTAMYNPEVHAYTPAGRLRIQGR